MYIGIFKTETEGLAFLKSFDFDVQQDEDKMYYVKTDVLDIVEKRLMTGYYLRRGFEVYLELVKKPIGVQLVNRHNEQKIVIFIPISNCNQKGK